MPAPSANHPTILVIFGATGDVVAKKIVPALFHAFEAGTLPPLFHVVGFSRRDIPDPEFREYVAGLVREKMPKATEEQTKKFVSLFSYSQGLFDGTADYTRLAEKLGRVDGEWKACSNKLFYLAVPPDAYEVIFNNLAKSGLTEPCSDETGWTRVLVEKPIGIDAASAEKIDTLLGSLFKEEQVYRIEHYLAKEMLRNILLFRFANNLFEDIWNNRHIERVHLRLWETLGVETRGNFYDHTGALRDVGQNHLLQMLALTTMERPDALSAEQIRQKRTEILSRLQVIDEKDIAAETFRAQYDGYRQIPGVDPKSETETYAAIKAHIDHPRWSGVPFILEAGKRLGRVRKEIEIELRHPMPCLCPPEGHRKNRIIISLEPEERILVELWSKVPNKGWEAERRSLDLLWREPGQRMQYAEEYERVLLDAIKGDQTLFVGTDELRAMWRFTDPILSAWKQGKAPLETYKPDTDEAAIQGEAWFETNGASTLAKHIGIIGLGKMGGGLARHLMEKEWKVVGYNRSPEVTNALATEGLDPALSHAEFVKKLPTPRIVWLMLPAGKAVDDTLFGDDGLMNLLDKGDIIIDGGNSYFKDDVPRAEKLAQKGIRYLDVGVSGGPAGARNGACLMIGGTRDEFEYLEPLFRDASLSEGYAFFDGIGAGHFTKMVHNGIEYGMMQAIAEGFHVLKASPYKLSLTEVTRIYDRGSVIESRLINWLGRAFAQNGEDLKGISGSVSHTGEGAWTVKTAEELGVAAEIIKGSLDFRVRSTDHPDYTGQVLSALRGQFGGHPVSDKPDAGKK